MFDIFKDTLQNGMGIGKCKELANKYKLVLLYDDMSASCELSKMCTPGNEKSLCMQAIDNAISSMYIDKGDLNEAEAWLHGERWNLEVKNQKNVKSNYCKLCGNKFDFRKVLITNSFAKYKLAFADIYVSVIQKISLDFVLSVEEN